MSSVSISDQEKLIRSLPDVLPVLPLKNTVLFPYSILPLSVSGEKSAVAVDRALADHRMLMLVAQRDPSTDDPGESDLHPVGTAALVVRDGSLPRRPATSAAMAADLSAIEIRCAVAPSSTSATWSRVKAHTTWSAAPVARASSAAFNAARSAGSLPSTP